MEKSKELVESLLANPNVMGVVNGSVLYTKEFKLDAIQKYYQGMSAREIFEKAGFNLTQLSNCRDYASKLLAKWRKSASKTKNIHYPKKKRKKAKTDYQKMQTRLEYLEAENEFLKKLSVLCDEYRA